MLTVAEILRAAGAAYRDRFGERLLPSHRRAMRDLETCRTPARGGHLYACDECGEREFRYHSCRHRFCPQCQGHRAQAWGETVQQGLLPCPYFLVTFTVPEALRTHARAHQRALYDLLFRAAAQSLQTLAQDPRYLGARPGMLAVLHTWTRDLHLHPHVHFLVTAGGLDGDLWRLPPRRRFLFPGRVLSVLFRNRIRAGLAAQGHLDAVPRKVWRQKWVVHVQAAGDGRAVVAYLGRYLFRPPLSNSQLEHFDGDRVRFRYRDGASKQTRRCTLPVDELLRRFLQHVLPRGFTRVRYYGCFSPSSRGKLGLARALLEQQAAASGESIPGPLLRVPEPESAEPAEGEPGGEPRRCSACGVGRLQPIAVLPRASAVRPPPRAPP